MAGMSGPPLTERAQPAFAGSSGRIVGRRLTTAPGPDPVPLAAHDTSFDCAHWSSCRGQHRSLCRRLGGGPAHDGGFHRPRTRPRTDRGSRRHATSRHTNPLHATNAVRRVRSFVPPPRRHPRGGPEVASLALEFGPKFLLGYTSSRTDPSEPIRLRQNHANYKGKPSSTLADPIASTRQYPNESGSIRPATATQNATRLLPDDAGLAAVVDAWPDLPEAVKAGIVAMVKAASGGPRWITG